MAWCDYFYYKNGKIYNLFTRSPNALVDCEAGTKHSSGYIHVSLNRKIRKAHRIIWEMHNGPIPQGMEIDHINHIRDDNRIDNLRLVTKSENQRNKAVNAKNTSGFVGVTYVKKSGKWQAGFKIKGKFIFVGCFDNVNDAALARDKAAKMYNFHENHGEKIENFRAKQKRTKITV